MRFALLLSVLALLPSFASAQTPGRSQQPTKTAAPPSRPASNSAASLADTLTWLRDNIRAETPQSARDKIELIEFTSCTIQWAEHSIEPAIPGISPAYHDITKYTVPLADIDPSRIDAIAYDNPDGSKVFVVHLPTKANKASITIDVNTSSYKKVSMGPETGFHFLTNEAAQRSVKAFAHAAQLCAKQPF